LTQTNFSLLGDYADLRKPTFRSGFLARNAMFIIGCGATLIRIRRGTMENARELAATLGGKYARILDAPLRPVSGPPELCVRSTRASRLQQFSRDELVKDERTVRPGKAQCQTMLARLERGEKLPCL